MLDKGEHELVEVTWLDITERDIEPHMEPGVVELAVCRSWGVLVDNGPVVRLIRETQGETRTVQAFPRSCIKQIRKLEYGAEAEGQ